MCMFSCSAFVNEALASKWAEGVTGCHVVAPATPKHCMYFVPPAPLQDLRYIFIPSDIRDYVMLKSAILGSRVQEGYDRGDE